MSKALLSLSILAVISLGLTGCDPKTFKDPFDYFPGKPDPNKRWKPPTAVLDFEKLYKMNCLGCHGNGSTVAGSLSLNNPTYLSVITPETLHKVIAHGVEGKGMPGFSEEDGGPLTDAQIEVLVKGIMAWKPATVTPTTALPAYSAPLGNAAAGAAAFATYCASCQGVEGKGGEKAGSIVDPAYLGMVSDQYLRTIVIAGRNDLGCPDFQNRVPGKAMSEQEVSDVTAWLVSHRKNEFGQPLVPAIEPAAAPAPAPATAPAQP